LRPQAKPNPDYYYNLEEQGTGHPMFRCWHITADYFLLQMYREILPWAGNPSVTWVSVPLSPLNTANSLVGAFLPAPALYKIDPATAKATKGLTIITNNSVSAIGKLSATN